MPKHIDYISCGQGAPSLFLIVLAGELKAFHADLVIVADTGWENDCLWSSGQRTDARAFFERVTAPLAQQYGMEAAFVRSRDRFGNNLPDIQDAQILTSKDIADGWIKGEDDLASFTTMPEREEDFREGTSEGNNYTNIDIPLFGSKGGRLKQSCTGKWKVAACRQEVRRRGAETATCALGMTITEARRIRNSDVLWCSQHYPLIKPAYTGNKGWHRAACIQELEDRGIPYLITSECDGCPHKDAARWARTDPAVIQQLAEWEKGFHGEFFLTDQRIPLLDALENMKQNPNSLFDDIPCQELGYCFL